MANHIQSKEPALGLVNLRASKKSEPVLCTNCNCKRYGPCGCRKKGVKPAKENAE